MKSTFFIFIFIFFSSCNPSKLPNHVRFARKVTAVTVKKIQQQTGFSLIGTGGSMMDDIKIMTISFDSSTPLNLEGSRRILIQLIQEYLFEINNNIEIRPYLHEYPFTEKNIEIIICFYNKDQSNISPDKINLVSKRTDKIIYYIDDPIEDNIQFFHEETYKEACQRLGEKP